MSVERRQTVRKVLAATVKEVIYTPKDIVVGARRNFKDIDMNGAFGLAGVSLVGGLVALLTVNPAAGVLTAAALYGTDFKLEGSFVRHRPEDY